MPENHHTFCIKFDPPKLGGILHEFDPIVLAGAIRRSTRDPVNQISSTIFDRYQGNLAPENRPSHEETCIPSMFRCDLLVSGRVILHMFSPTCESIQYTVDGSAIRPTTRDV